MTPHAARGGASQSGDERRARGPPHERSGEENGAVRLGWRIGTVVLCGLGLAARPAAAADLWGDIDLLGQVREGYQDRETQAPVDLYGNLGAARLWHGSDLETYFRLEQDLATGENAADFYAGYARVPNLLPGVQATVGRQFLNEGPGGVFVADAGKFTVDVGWPVSFTAYGGAPQYFEPTQSTPIVSQDELLWGGNVRTTRWPRGQLTLGYQQWERQNKVLRQLISGSAVQRVPHWWGAPQFYGTFGYDADRQNVDTGTGGVDFTVPAPLLLVNLAATYYQPQDNPELVADLDWQEDPLFQLYSNSNLVQGRGGIRKPFSRALTTYADYSFQTYDNAVDETQYGHLAHAGLQWLPEGDGLEQVVLAYFLADSSGGTVNGISVFYENRVYERIVFRFRTDVAYYDKESNQSDWPVHTLTGLGYELAPGLLGQLLFEANRNVLFDADLRFSFAVSYNFRHRVERPDAAAPARATDDVASGTSAPEAPS